MKGGRRVGGLELTHDDEFLTRPVAAADGELVINSSPDTVRCKKFNVAADTADEIHFLRHAARLRIGWCKKKKDALIEFFLFFEFFLFLFFFFTSTCVKVMHQNALRVAMRAAPACLLVSGDRLKNKKQEELLLLQP